MDAFLTKLQKGGNEHQSKQLKYIGSPEIAVEA